MHFFLGAQNWIQIEVNQNQLSGFKTCAIGSQMTPKWTSKHTKLPGCEKNLNVPPLPRSPLPKDDAIAGTFSPKPGLFLAFHCVPDDEVFWIKCAPRADLGAHFMGHVGHFSICIRPWFSENILSTFIRRRPIHSESNDVRPVKFGSSAWGKGQVGLCCINLHK